MRTVMEQWERVLKGEHKTAVEALLPAFLMTRRWFGGKARAVRSVRIIESVSIPSPSTSAVLLFVRVIYREGESETYVLPVTAAFGESAAQVQRDLSHTVIAPLEVKDQDQAGVLYDALWNPECAYALLQAIGQEARVQGESGTVIASSTRAYRGLVGGENGLTPVVMKAEQSNTSVAYDNRVILKLYRRLQAGLNPDLEIGRVLTTTDFPYSPRVGGAIEYARPEGEPVTVAILQAFVKNQGDAWTLTIEAFDRYLTQSRSRSKALDGISIPRKPLFTLAQEETPALARELIGSYLESVKVLGQRTAQLHVTLAQCRDNPAFTPEPMSLAYRRGQYESMCQLAGQTLALLRRRLHELSSAAGLEARRVLEAESEIMDRFRALLELESTALRIRCHGDYHLGQALWTGQDFVIVDFEGEPARPLSERRIKHPPVLDVAGMLRSFHYAPYTVLVGHRSDVDAGECREMLEPWLRFWYGWVSAEFLKAYVGIAGQEPFFPSREGEGQIMLDTYLLGKAVYEVGYEINNRPDWIRIPLRGILQLLQEY